MDKIFASAEQHRKWIRDGDISKGQWVNGLYKEYKGAHSDPSVKFDKPWSWFRGYDHSDLNSVGVKVASAEKHREWLWGKNFIDWASGDYKEYSHLGSICRPEKKYNLPGSYFTGRGHHRVNGLGVEVADDEQHREWISSEQCIYEEWSSGIYKKYAHLGAIACPYYSWKKKGWCKRNWGWFTGNMLKNNIMKRGGHKRMKLASAEQHKKWISENDYTITEWKKGEYLKFPGAISHPGEKFNKPWSWFRGYNDFVYLIDLGKNNFKRISINEYKQFVKNIELKHGYFRNNAFLAMLRRKKVTGKYKLNDNFYLITSEKIMRRYVENYYWIKNSNGKFERGFDDLKKVCSYLGEGDINRIKGVISMNGRINGKSIYVERKINKSKLNA